MHIAYETQRLSLRFFLLMLVLFCVQVALGLILAAQQADPSLLAGYMNFNVARAGHLFYGVLWILCGFIGATIFVAPMLAKRDLVAPWLIKLLFYALIVIVVWNSFSQFLAQKGIAGWWLNQPWLQNGLEYIEVGRLAGVGILIGFAIFAWVILRTFPPVKKWNELHWGLGLGVTALMLVWVFGLFYVSRIDLQEYFRWYVVHYWVEGIWEVIHITLIGTLLVLMFKASVRSVGFAVFWGGEPGVAVGVDRQRPSLLLDWHARVLAVLGLAVQCAGAAAADLLLLAYLYRRPCQPAAAGKRAGVLLPARFGRARAGRCRHSRLCHDLCADQRVVARHLGDRRACAPGAVWHLWHAGHRRGLLGGAGHTQRAPF